MVSAIPRRLGAGPIYFETFGKIKMLYFGASAHCKYSSWDKLPRKELHKLKTSTLGYNATVSTMMMNLRSILQAPSRLVPMDSHLQFHFRFYIKRRISSVLLFHCCSFTKNGVNSAWKCSGGAFLTGIHEIAKGLSFYKRRIKIRNFNCTSQLILHKLSTDRARFTEWYKVEKNRSFCLFLWLE